MALSQPPLALVLRALGLGDFLTGLPALRAVRAALPEHEIVLATPPVLAPLVDLAGAADRVLPVEGLTPLDWTGPTPDVAVNLHGRGPQSTRLLADLSAQRLVAFRSEAAAVEGPLWRADEHEVARWCRLVAEAFGVPADPTDLGLTLPGDAPRVEGAVVVHPGAAFPARRWPTERFAEVAAWAAARGFPVAVTGSAAERVVAERVATGAGLPAVAVLAGRTSLLELAALVGRARLVISGDTGVAHLATAYQTRSVVLFGPISPLIWGPPPSSRHEVLWRGGTPGDPWGESVDSALLAISAEEVISAATRLLPA